MSYETYFITMRIVLMIAIVVVPITMIVMSITLIRIAKNVSKLTEQNKKG